MMKIVVLIAVLLSGCSVHAPTYDYSPTQIKSVNVQGVDISTAMFEVVNVESSIENICYYVRPGTYKRTGRFPLTSSAGSTPLYDGKGIQISALCDRVHGLTIFDNKLCVVTVFEAVLCFDSKAYKVETKRLPVY